MYKEGGWVGRGMYRKGRGEVQGGVGRQGGKGGRGKVEGGGKGAE